MSDVNTSRTSRDSLRISSIDRPGWKPAASGHVPSVGDHVYCTEGPAEVVRLLGRISDGSRLMELRCGERGHAFFASSSNVLVRDPATEVSGFLDPGSAVGGS